MFKCSTGNLFLLWVLVFSTPTFADVHKWKDANGKTHYGDAPPMAGTEKVRTDKQTDDQIANGERIRAGTEKFEATEKQAEHSQKCQELAQIDRGKLTLGQAMAARREYEALCMSSGERQASQEKREKALVQMQQQQLRQQQQQALSNIGSSSTLESKGKMIISDRGYGSSTSGSTEIEMRRKYDYDPANKYRGEIDSDGTVRMKNLNGDRLRGTIEKDGYGKLRDEDGNTYRVRPR